MYREGDNGGVTMIQCPLCSRSFAQEVIELHAANCEGRAPTPPQFPHVSDAGQYRGVDEIQILDSQNECDIESFLVIGGEKPLPIDPQVIRKRKGGSRISSGESIGGCENNNSASNVKYSSRPNSFAGGIECPICNQCYSKSVIEEHAANCGDEVYV